MPDDCVRLILAVTITDGLVGCGSVFTTEDYGPRRAHPSWPRGAMAG